MTILLAIGNVKRWVWQCGYVPLSHFPTMISLKTHTWVLWNQIGHTLCVHALRSPRPKNCHFDNGNYVSASFFQEILPGGATNHETIWSINNLKIRPFAAPRWNTVVNIFLLLPHHLDASAIGCPVIFEFTDQLSYASNQVYWWTLFSICTTASWLLAELDVNML